MWQFGFPVRPRNFPGRGLREFVSKFAKSGGNPRPRSSPKGRIERFSLYFPSRSGNGHLRLVAMRLPPPPFSLRLARARGRDVCYSGLCREFAGSWAIGSIGSEQETANNAPTKLHSSPSSLAAHAAVRFSWAGGSGGMPRGPRFDLHSHIRRVRRKGRREWLPNLDRITCDTRFQQPAETHRLVSEKAGVEGSGERRTLVSVVEVGRSNGPASWPRDPWLQRDQSSTTRSLNRRKSLTLMVTRMRSFTFAMAAI